MHRFVDVKRVKESEQMSYISVESSKGSFRKIQIFELGYSALPLFYSLFRFKNHYCVESVVYTKSVKNR